VRVNHHRFFLSFFVSIFVFHHQQAESKASSESTSIEAPSFKLKFSDSSAQLIHPSLVVACLLLLLVVTVLVFCIVKVQSAGWNKSSSSSNNISEIGNFLALFPTPPSPPLHLPITATKQARLLSFLSIRCV